MSLSGDEPEVQVIIGTSGCLAFTLAAIPADSRFPSP
jgi:hypothetical protein